MVQLNILGDFCIRSEFLSKIDINAVDEELKTIFDSADLNILNLEGPITEKNTPMAKFGPSIRMDKEVVNLIEQLGFKMVTLANNHILDQGARGLTDTLKILNDRKISHTGAGNNLAEASQPFITEIKGLKIGFLNFAENEFSNSYDDKPGANPFDLVDNTLAIQKLRAEVDKLVVIFHGGAEMHSFPSPRIKKLFRFFIDQGADAVVGHHTHIYNGFEIYKGQPIVYGVGNFIFPVKDSSPDFNLGAAANLTFTESETRLEIIPFKLKINEKLEVDVLKDEELTEFRKQEKRMSEIIADDILLAKEFDRYISENKLKYKHYLQPFTSKYLHKLHSLGVIPSFLDNSRKRLLYLNLIRCEAHRDVLLKIMDDE